ncbi:hypothetical protein FGO68_gene13924 [Halteria grandinella]|uniref:Uncharacterized protein n=1 Tax=Halteria grandinella TaxID=5974 RepID=A0A8J8NHR5_HALGN|nr:hypothetical protein FGO68_gene13924 [Halteria grandinella]
MEYIQRQNLIVVERVPTDDLDAYYASNYLDEDYVDDSIRNWNEWLQIVTPEDQNYSNTFHGDSYLELLMVIAWMQTVVPAVLSLSLSQVSQFRNSIASSDGPPSQVLGGAGVKAECPQQEEKLAIVGATDSTNIGTAEQAEDSELHHPSERENEE